MEKKLFLKKNTVKRCNRFVWFVGRIFRNTNVHNAKVVGTAVRTVTRITSCVV